jgi:hypothetical protein
MKAKLNLISDLLQAQGTNHNRNHRSVLVELETYGTGAYATGQCALRGYGECYNFNVFPFYNTS